MTNKPAVVLLKTIPDPERGEFFGELPRNAVVKMTTT
jgi:hypothetical protein